MKRIIIIGASSGLGKEIALHYAKQGNIVGITGRRGEILESLKSQHQNQIFTAGFDVRSKENISRFLQLVQYTGGLDLLIYNAGFGEPSTELNVETEMATVETNVSGCVAIVGTAFNFFLQQGYGQIAITSSVAALRGNSWAPAYSGSKAFISNYSESLNIKARKLKKNIVITDIRPGFVNTHMAKGNRRFWVASPNKAALQMVKAIEQKKWVAYITKRWWLVAQIMKFLPYGLYRRIV